MVRFYALLFFCLAIINSAAAQISLTDEERKDTSADTPVVEKQKKEDDALFNFLGLKIPNFISSKSDQPDENSVVVLAQKAADGDVASQLKLGYAYLYGSDGLQVNYDKAFHYYNLAAQQNDAIGLNNLGSLYYNGIGTKRNSHKAALLFAKAVEAGNFDAATNLGFMYITGNGIEQDINVGLNYFEKAAEGGNVLSQFMIGYAYYLGLHRQKNYNIATKYIKKAADAGLDEAQVILANMYMNGQGFPQNYSNAVKYLSAATKQGNVEAMLKLADILSSGKKYPQNISEAHVLYNLASVRGADTATARRNDMEKKMEISDILNAQRDAENFQEKTSPLTNYVRQTFGYNIHNYIK